MKHWISKWTLATLTTSVLLAAFGASAQVIPYRANVSLEVGQSAILHGARGKCGEAAPDWDHVVALLPLVSTGNFSDGGVGSRSSGSCGGPTPARAVRFTATTGGSEQIELFGDPINITVKSTAPDVSTQVIPYRENVSLLVGQSTIVHGARGRCGQAAPSWDDVISRLPVTSTGTFSDGGLGTRRSGSCGGTTPARAVRFTATTPGNEKIELYGDPINIDVQ